jgi:hypothetical protein
MKTLSKILLLFMAVVIISGCISNDKPTTSTNVQTTTPISSKIENDSIQQTVKQITENGTQNAIKQAVANGNLSLKDMDGPPEYNTQIVEKNDSHVKLELTTKIKFKDPKGAGISDNKWPKFQINASNLSVNGTKGNVTSGDYDQQIKDSISSEIKNMTNDSERNEINNSWNNYSFESGQRTYEINETYDVTFSNTSESNNILQNNSTNNYSIVLGFTKYIKDWHYSKEENFDITLLWWSTRIAWVRADADMDAALGLRLPLQVSLDAPNMMVSGQSYNLNTKISGIEWNAAEYQAANVPAENGNAFVARFNITLSVQAWIKYIGDIGPYTFNKDLDYGKAFKTPFGPNEKFPIPELDLPPGETGLKFNDPYFGAIWIGMGLEIIPILGSDKITAKWDAGGDSVGNGSVEYDLADSNYNFGPIITNDYDKNNNYANIKLTDYNYYFNICSLNLDANVQGGLTFMPLTIPSPYMTIFSYDCSGIKDLSLTAHEGTNANSVYTSIPIGPNGKVMSMIAWENSQTNDTQTNITVPLGSSVKFNTTTNYDSDYYNRSENLGSTDPKNLFLEQQFSNIGSFTVKIAGENNTYGWANQTWNVTVELNMTPIAVVNITSNTTSNESTNITSNTTSNESTNITSNTTSNESTTSNTTSNESTTSNTTSNESTTSNTTSNESTTSNTTSNVTEANATPIPTDTSLVTPTPIPTDTSLVTPTPIPTDTSLVTPTPIPTDTSLVTPNVTDINATPVIESNITVNITHTSTDTSLVTQTPIPTDTSLVTQTPIPTDTSLVTPTPIPTD